MLLNIPKVAKKTWHFLNKPRFVASSGGGVSNLNNPAPWLLNNILGGGLSKSGADVGEVTALQLTAYFGAIRNISEDIAKLPVNIFERLEDNQKKIVNQQFPEIFNVIDNRSNKFVSSMSFYETWISHALSWGNGYAEIQRDGTGTPRAVHIVHPSRVKLRFIRNELFYEISSDNTSIPGRDFKIARVPARNMLHLHGLGGDGIVGYSLFFLGREALGLTISAQAYASSYYSNGTSLTGVLEMPGTLDKESQERLRESWARLHQGNACNQHGIAILEGDTKFKPISDSAQASQLLEARKFQVLEMARLLRMPPHKIAQLDFSSFTNIESENIGYFRDTITPWVKRISKEISWKFFGDNPEIFTMHEINALTLGDSKTRMEVFKGYRNLGVLSANEVRSLENLNRSEVQGMDDYNMQSNITTIQQVSEGNNLKDQNKQVSDSEGGRPSGSTAQARTFKPMTFERAKANNLPTFQYAARRIIEKENKAVKTHVQDKKHNTESFKKWAKGFFQRQTMEIIENFGPAVLVFINTCESIELIENYGFLPAYAEKYSADGFDKAMKAFDDGVHDDIEADENIKNMAENIINLISSTE